MLNAYLHAISLIERMHRQFLDVVKAELDGQRIRDINNVQALILFNIGTDELTVGELTQRGYYLGSNVSYNVKKMVEHGYLKQERSEHDRRSVRVSLSDKGKTLWDRMDAMFKRHQQLLEESAISIEQIGAATTALSDLERFWMHAAQSAPRAPEPLIGKPVDRNEAAAYFGD
ncbi:MAG: MarR family winged helix-turn-helix transcriptional regulator [Alphaproteobacteria bacterium]|jgi:DNA-binding MarR family transcriptional regulator